MTQSSVRAIIALGVAGLILTQGTDLSAGRQVGLAAVISATMLQAVTNVNRVFGLNRELPIIYAIIVVCLVGLVIGIINGLIVAKLSVHPFIATLGSMTVVYGINSLYYDIVGASPISGFSSKYSAFAQGAIELGGFSIPYLIIYASIATIIMWTLWNKQNSEKYFCSRRKSGGGKGIRSERSIDFGRNLCFIRSILCLWRIFGSGKNWICDE